MLISHEHGEKAVSENKLAYILMVLYLVKFEDHISAKLVAIETISCSQVSSFLHIAAESESFRFCNQAELGMMLEWPTKVVSLVLRGAEDCAEGILVLSQV